MLLRAFFRPPAGEAARLTDGEWGERAHAALAPVLGLTRAPARVWVARWPDALPQSSPDRVNVLHAARRRLAARAPIEFAGAFYGSRGVDGAVRSGVDAARAIAAALGGRNHA